MHGFRTRSKTVSALQWAGPDQYRSTGVFQLGIGSKAVFFIVTAQGTKAYLSPGDWIITHSNGVNHYLCDPVTFSETYEQV